VPPALACCHATLHEGRTMALADMPRGCDTVLSMGANGEWYFTWFDQSYGRIPRHIGVEAYMPRPAVLPDNVEWVEADLASPEGVAMLGPDSVDLVFSGQNIEHLWPEQVEAFLVESNRVLRDGGWLVVDSPNRDLTAAYQWSMGEHTIEFTPGEATELLGLAGFEVVTMKGVWLCRKDGELLALEPDGTLEGSADVLRRLMLGTSRPEDSFIWWAEARKVGEPDTDGLRAAIGAVFEANWRERVARMRPEPTAAQTVMADGRTAAFAKGQSGIVMMGPWLALRRGAYEVSVEVTWSGLDDPGAAVAVLEVVAGEELVGTAELVPDTPDGVAVLSCPFALDDLRFAVHTRLVGTGAAAIEVPISLSMPTSPYGVGTTA